MKVLIVPKIPMIPGTMKRRRNMKRPVLNKVPLDDMMNGLIGGKPSITVTMSPGQWDRLLQSAYDAGHNLIEVDDNEIPVRAYRKKLDA